MLGKTSSIVSATIWLVFAAGTAGADCMKDQNGEFFCGKGQCQRDQSGMVLCSAFLNGGAVRNYRGQIVCGRGHCIETSKREVICSTEQEGGVLLDRFGRPRCQGQCEEASAELCEARPAATL